MDGIGFAECYRTRLLFFNWKAVVFAKSHLCKALVTYVFDGVVMLADYAFSLSSCLHPLQAWRKAQSSCTNCRIDVA